MHSRLIFSLLSLLVVSTGISAELKVAKPDDIAGNEAVKKIMETRPGRGVMPR